MTDITARAARVEMLQALGIRFCRECLCTDAVACPGGCGWAGADLCTRCVPGGAGLRCEAA
jgi:hypothetical protein